MNEITTKSSIRGAIGQQLFEIASRHPRVIGLCADLSESLKMDKLAKELPDQYVECGVAEQNMIGLAAGIASCGLKPYVGGFAAFSPGRNYDQIRISVAYSNLPVTILASHAGIGVGPDGATHQMLEDIAMMQALPNMTVISPCDAQEARELINQSLTWTKPLYIRYGRGEFAEISSLSNDPILIGKARKYSEGDDVTILAFGWTTSLAILTASLLNQKGVKCAVYGFNTAKPLDLEALNLINTPILTIEDGQAVGGFGASISAYCAQNKPLKIVNFGIKDKFGYSATESQLYEDFGFTPENLLKVVLEMVIEVK